MLTPWMVEELDEESAAAFDALDELNKQQDDKRKSKQEFEGTLANVRAKSGYRSYLKK